MSIFPIVYRLVAKKKKRELKVRNFNEKTLSAKVTDLYWYQKGTFRLLNTYNF